MEVFNIIKPVVVWWGKAAMTRMIEVRGFANRDLRCYSLPVECNVACCIWLPRIWIEIRFLGLG